MAVYHLKVSVGSKASGHSAAAKHDYVAREGKYAEREGRDSGEQREVAGVESEHMPAWAQDDARRYWDAADRHERANGRVYREVQFALPKELPERDQCALASRFARSLTAAERLPYTLSVHRGAGRNPHAHLVISERVNDGIERPAAQWFKRHNAAEPEVGGARKSRALMPREWLQEIRASWAQTVNETLERHGLAERVDHRSLAVRAIEAYDRGDFDAAAQLSREPGVHLGPGATDREVDRVMAGRPSLHVVEKHQEVESRNAAAAARWTGYETEISRLQRGIADIARELGEIPQRLVEAAERVREWVRDHGRGAPERDYGGHER